MDQPWPVANLLVAGVIKTGTTSLYAYLIQHPDICPPIGRKEIDFFTPMRWGGRPVGTVQQYASHFSACSGERYRLDASPQYFDGGRPLVDAVRTYAPSARILIVLRDPVGRIWSQYRANKSTQKLPPEISFNEYFERGVDVYARERGQLQDTHGYRGVSLGCYIDFLRDWLDVFGAAVRVVFYEHIVQDAKAVVADTCTWLDLDSEPAEQFNYTVRNRTVDPRSVLISRFGYALNRRLGPTLNRLPAAKDALRSAYAALNRRRQGEQLSDQGRKMAEDFYLPANKALHAELSEQGYTKLPQWLTSSVGAP